MGLAAGIEDAIRATSAHPAGRTMTSREVLCRVAVLPGGRVHRVLLASMSHPPPSAVPLLSDVRFRRSAQRLARLT
jgi:hypothetical protein